MCLHHRIIPAAEVEPQGGLQSTFGPQALITRERTLGAILGAVPTESLPKPPDKPVIAERPSLPISQTITTRWDTSRVIARPAPAPQPAPEVREPAWFAPRTPERRGTAPNPRKAPKSVRIDATTSKTNTSTLRPDGTVDVDKLLEYIHSVPPKGGRHRRRR
jgi:hypothetical protein